jgi:hypothetical protein
VGRNPDLPRLVTEARQARVDEQRSQAGRLDSEQIERLAALQAKLEAIVEGAPDVSEEDLVDEILSRRQG